MKKLLILPAAVGRVALLSVLFVLFLHPALGADLKSAEQAFEQHDYQKALKQFRPFASKGDPAAQR